MRFLCGLFWISGFLFAGGFRAGVWDLGCFVRARVGYCCCVRFHFCLLIFARDVSFCSICWNCDCCFGEGILLYLGYVLAPCCIVFLKIERYDWTSFGAIFFYMKTPLCYQFWAFCVYLRCSRLCQELYNIIYIYIYIYYCIVYTFIFLFI